MSEAASQDDRTMAMIGHLSGIVAGFIGPLIIWLINKEKTDKVWLNDQAKEALNFQITLLIAYFVSGILTLVAYAMTVARRSGPQCRRSCACRSSRCGSRSCSC